MVLFRISTLFFDRSLVIDSLTLPSSAVFFSMLLFIGKYLVIDGEVLGFDI